MRGTGFQELTSVSELEDRPIKAIIRYLPFRDPLYPVLPDHVASLPLL